MQDECLLVITSCPTHEVASDLAKLLVESRLAACAQISAPRIP
ncbi:divalent cation tolerance protein CutA [Shewanella hanedai]|uniref:Divalent-cation tolerance protein CutA n=1 Tax=Shewanella hanedai TaxID=25 RepID=A0A553JUR4_SHEHA|nr:divalent cation tolerance protein CutA [Shewanella hanedai]TRY16192.1 divalent-cation tolerance protein CutA [Shewanella hanedai]